MGPIHQTLGHSPMSVNPLTKRHQHGDHSTFVEVYHNKKPSMNERKFSHMVDNPE
jgi:hypothetical protein